MAKQPLKLLTQLNMDIGKNIVCEIFNNIIDGKDKTFPKNFIKLIKDNYNSPFSTHYIFLRRKFGIESFNVGNLMYIEVEDPFHPSKKTKVRNKTRIRILQQDYIEKYAKKLFPHMDLEVSIDVIQSAVNTYIDNLDSESNNNIHEFFNLLKRDCL